MVGGSHKKTVERGCVCVAARETDLAKGSDVAQTERAVLFQTNWQFSETGVAEPGAFFGAAKAIQRKQSVEYLLLYFFEESMRSPLV